MGCGCSCEKSTAGRDIKDLYKIGAVLGSGSFGQVRTCVKKSTNEQFAVKIMSKDPPKEKRGSNHVDFAMMFRNEVTILTQLSNPHIVRLHGFFEDKNYLYAIMDKCEGGELFAQIVKKRRIPEKDAACLCFQMLTAIHFVHSCGIVHRDIKAENFLFCERTLSSRLVLIDFGMSTKVTDDRFLKQLCGSPHYVAPELIRRNYRFKVDMWALGVVVFLMLYGRYPFEGADQKAIVRSILNEEPEYSSRSVPISSVAIDFMQKLLDKNPDKRLGPDEALQHEWIVSHKHVVEQRFQGGGAEGGKTPSENFDENHQKLLDFRDEEKTHRRATRTSATPGSSGQRHYSSSHQHSSADNLNRPATTDVRTQQGRFNFNPRESDNDTTGSHLLPDEGKMRSRSSPQLNEGDEKKRSDVEVRGSSVATAAAGGGALVMAGQVSAATAGGGAAGVIENR